jgi:hypothetical protein
MYKIRISLCLILTLGFFIASAQTGRTVIDLSNNNWKLWLDTAAKWTNDKLYAPPVDIEQLPVNPPTGGWDILKKAISKTVHLPATVEQFYWGKNGNDFGLSGNYLGVSWFTATCMIPASQKGKRISLQFEAVRYRAEIFINRKLAGYDLVNSTPFEVDITDYIQYGNVNEIAIRITDPNGNFDWRDSQNFMWGNYRTNPTHGFGGITGKLKLVASSKTYLQDIFIKNKPITNEIDAEISLANETDNAVNGSLLLQVKEAKANGKTVFQKTYAYENLPVGTSTRSYTLRINNAMRWSVDSPNLYTLSAQWTEKDKTVDIYSKRFGFRWFEIREVSGDKQYYLNNKRIVLRSAISWGFWPINGIAPSDALARKQVEDAKKLGLNMLNFHRTIGQQNVLDYADELGLLYFEEPGGNQYPADRFNVKDSLGRMQSEFYFATRNEKLARMIRRDRSHPSLVIYNLHNERGAEPQQQDREQMRMAHQLDETRILTYNSSNGSIKQGADPRFKLHLLPYDTSFYDFGWFDQHHAGGPGVYHDNLYRNPREYLRYTDKKDEIVYYGEEGAIGTPPRLELIRNQILKDGKDIGWETKDYLRWYDAYNNFLLAHPGFHKAFPSVDSLTKAMGNVAYYYQGRTIENIRINNTVDGYAVNGWESMKLENHSGIVDNYRNLKGDAQLIAKYNQPLYISVKTDHKISQPGDSISLDFFIVNEKDISGSFLLSITASDDKAAVIWKKSIPVKVSGGNVYGELLAAHQMFSPKKPGYATVSASLMEGNKTIATGTETIYSIKLNKESLPAEIMVADTTGTLTNYLKNIGYTSIKEYRSGRPEGNCLLIGAYEPQQTGNPLVTDILEWVNEGNTLVIVNNIDSWAQHLARKEVIDYRGMKVLGTSWYGGNYFFKDHPFFAGLPATHIFNWEYQCFATYNKSRMGLRLFNGEPVVACVSDHKQEVYSALSVVPHGRGRIVLCALDIFSCIKDVKAATRPEGDGENAAMSTFNTNQQNAANLIGQQLLLNMLK